MKYILCHYSEIALKGKNRKFFEECLMANIRRVLKPSFFNSVKRISGRILVDLTESGSENREEIKERMSFIFGLSDFSFCNNVPQDIEKIKKAALESLEGINFTTFRISAKRSNKLSPLSSRDVNEKVGEFILGKIQRARVDLDSPEATCFIEIVEKYAFVFTEKNEGLKGLPVESGGKAVSLLSGGIDSPVASFLAMGRGIRLVFVHFHSYPETSKASLEKVREIVRILSKYQGVSKLYMVPFSEIQKEIMLSVSPKLRVIFYRRMMFRIAHEIMKKEDAGAIVTGESIGQVASQTLENMRATEESVDALIIRPLDCKDKESIVKKAGEIGTFSVSILPHDDCCVRFIPEFPETRARLREVLKEEEKIDVDKLTDKAIRELSCEKIYGFNLDKRN